MPTRTLIQELCDVCYGEDGTETEATDRLRFSWQGRDYLLLVCENHVSPIRDEIQRLSDIATPQGPGRRSSPPVAPRPARVVAERPETGAKKTRFSQLNDEEKARFRKWANLPNARRIADSRVEEWQAAGKP